MVSAFRFPSAAFSRIVVLRQSVSSYAKSKSKSNSKSSSKDMASTDTAVPTSEAHQAGGGAGDNQRSVNTLDEHLLPHLRQVFEAHAGPDQKWGKDQIKTFVYDIQHHDYSEDAKAAAGGLLDLDELDFNGFLKYMTSSHSAITNPPKPTDLSYPLASYFISSSHNTYLSGNQLSSRSTTDSYTNVLQRGCRCVEIDVWNGEESDSDASSSDDEGVRRAKAANAEHRSKEKEKKKSHRLSRLGTFREKLPDSLSARLDKTSLGRKIDEREAKKESVASASATPNNADGKEGEDDAPEVGLVEPRVLHGYTLTKEITFRDVCIAIGKSAFSVTDTPLIVSLEVHCSPAQQATMVHIMKEIWADYLVPEPTEEPTALPSPGELKKKILIKVKYAPPGSSPDQEDSGGDDDDRAPVEDKPKKPSKIIQDLSRMGCYARGVSFKSFTQPEASWPTHIFSLSEKKFLDFHEQRSSELWDHNKQFLMRAYPKGLRITSTNLNPAPFWGSGTQIVALNWQQTDEGMMLNEGMFAGTNGYVLKPEGYHPEHIVNTKSKQITCKTLSLSLTFLAAQNIPLPPEDKSERGFEPYIKAELHIDASEGQRGGHINSDGHEREGEYKARTKTYRGRDVAFEDDTLVFKDVPGLVEELTFLRFTIRDDEIGRDDLAAWACVRLDRLGQGYRFIHLLDCEGRVTDGVVLVKVEKKLV